jgi:hypothetical protein
MATIGRNFEYVSCKKQEKLSVSRPKVCPPPAVFPPPAAGRIRPLRKAAGRC